MKNLKKIETSSKSLAAAMFMATVCLYMLIGAVISSRMYDVFYYHIPFSLLIQGVVLSLAASAVWMASFAHSKKWGFFARYLLAFTILALLFGASVLIPAINSETGHLRWLLSSFIATLGMGTALAIKNEKYFKSTGNRSVLIWELEVS